MTALFIPTRPSSAPASGTPFTLTLMALLAGLMGLFSAGLAQAQSTPESFADLAQKLSPAVVNISTTQVIESRQPQEMPQFPPGSPFEDFFKEFFDRNGPNGGQNGNPKKRRATSLGSGFIIDYKSNGDAYVVTNNHVVQDADEVAVILHDDTRLEAEIVGRDAKSDLAVLKIKAKKKLPSVSFGDSEAARVGDWVVAIGNPFGLGGTVTAGIISARGRDIRAGPYDNFIQTDASINRGNSGGPMFNMKGEVIGINTAIFSPSGGSVGIGFAIPASSAQPVIEQLINNGEVSRGWLGVNIQEVTASIAEALNLGEAKGALVSNVTPGSPADDAGIKPRDVIISFNGKSVTEMRKLPRMVAATAVGKTVKVSVWRDGGEKKLSVTIGKLAEATEVAKADSDNHNAGSESIDELGMTVIAITSAQAERFDLGEDASGVLIIDVNGEGSAARERLRPGDIIKEVSQQKVQTPADVIRLVGEAVAKKRSSVLLLIESQSGFRFVAPSLGD